MTSALPPLSERRARLIAEAANQRRALAADVEVWRRSLSFADRAIAAARFIGNHPAWAVGRAVAPAALRSTGLVAWVRRGVAALHIVRGLRAAAHRPAAADRLR